MALRANRGFTLPELLIVVAVMGVMLGAGVPSFVEFIKNQRVKTASFDLFSSLIVARSEAITRNTNVTVTPASTTNWANGWTITYVDGAATITLREQSALPNITIARKDSGPGTIVYRGSGRLNQTPAPKLELTATGATVTTRCITVDLGGRPQTQATACP
jgi:type IV fimbrial biogenesis protein FimT